MEALKNNDYPDHERMDRLSEEDLLGYVQGGPFPRHVAVIMDGNGRWAEQRRLPRVAGHREGIQSVREVLALCCELKVRFLTIYAFSLENWQRPQDEVDELMSLLEAYLRKDIRTLLDHHVRFQTIGRTDQLPGPIRRLLREVERKTAQNKEVVLTAALSYGGRQEIVDAAARMVKDVGAGQLNVEKMDEALFAKYLYNTDLPDPDLMIRTSGEMRISNFLLWQLAYTELYFTKTPWPDFRKRDFLLALYDYQQRERRFGLIREQVQGRKR